MRLWVLVPNPSGRRRGEECGGRAAAGLLVCMEQLGVGGPVDSRTAVCMMVVVVVAGGAQGAPSVRSGALQVGRL